MGRRFAQSDGSLPRMGLQCSFTMVWQWVVETTPGAAAAAGSARRAAEGAREGAGDGPQDARRVRAAPARRGAARGVERAGGVLLQLRREAHAPRRRRCALLRGCVGAADAGGGGSAVLTGGARRAARPCGMRRGGLDGGIAVCFRHGRCGAKRDLVAFRVTVLYSDFCLDFPARPVSCFDHFVCNGLRSISEWLDVLSAWRRILSRTAP